MTIKNRAKWIASVLDAYFPEPQVPLKHHDLFTLLIAVLLSARCTDARVNQITPALFALASTAEKMAQLDPAQVQEIIRPCGLSPQKSKNIVALSKILVEKHQGAVPKTFEELEELPGVGHKTASVVMTQGFAMAAFPVDTHIHRLSKRWGLSSGKSVKQTEADLKQLFPKSQWGKIHLQMIHYGRTFCPARGHDIQSCPICSKLTAKS